MIKTCPECGQLLPAMRFGVRLTPLKARIVDLIKRSPDGIDIADLFDMVFSNDRRHKRETLKSHVWQINDLLEDAGYRIVGKGGCYRLTKVETEHEAKHR